MRQIKTFISYTMRDEYVNTQLLTAVEESFDSHLLLYIDVLHNDSLKKQLRVEEELINSELVILLKSESTKKSKWVQRELWLAETNNIPILDVHINSSMSVKGIILMLLRTILSSGQLKASRFFADAKIAPL